MEKKNQQQHRNILLGFIFNWLIFLTFSHSILAVISSQQSSVIIKNSHLSLSRTGRSTFEWSENMFEKKELLRFWNAVLCFVFYVTIFLSLFMVCWILIFPSSWLQGNSSYHDIIVWKAVDLSEYFLGLNFPIPRSMISKFSKQWAIQFLHIFPAWVWSALIPLQIYPGKRSNYHRFFGYVFTTTSFMMIVGLYFIFQRGLLFVHFDFPSIAEVGLAVEYACATFPVL